MASVSWRNRVHLFFKSSEKCSVTVLEAATSWGCMGPRVAWIFATNAVAWLCG
jgi:hypothetical protein